MGYRIKTVAELTGIPRNTLLAWERRYGLLAPERQSNGYREFSEQDVASLKEIKRLVDAGHKVSEAINLLGDRVKALSPPLAELPNPLGIDQLREQLVVELLTYQRERADRIVPRLAMFGYSRLVLDLYFPILRELGDRWSRGEITVAQEHFASEFCREQLVAMLLSLACGPVGGPRVVSAGYPGERHDGGILGLSVLLALQGWRVTYLGADVPLPDLLLMLRDARPAMVCVGLTLTQSTGELVAYARALRAGCGEGVRVVLGGRGVDPTLLPSLRGVEWLGSAPDLLTREAAK